MTWFKRLSIQRKFSLAILFTCTTALALAATGILFTQLNSFRQSFRRDLTAIGQIIAKNSAPSIAFSNRKDAQELLAALKAKSHIVYARLSLPDGTEFASFSRGELAASPITPHTDGFHLVGPYLVLDEPILLDHERIGTLRLVSAYEAEFRRWLQLYAAIMAAVLLGAIVLALVLSNRLQRLISAPILDLAGTAQQIARQKDYTVRANKQAEDEVGVLTEAFNAMLAQLERDDAALRQANQDLQEEIEEREQAQAALRESEEHFRSLFENATIGLYRTSPAGQVLLANPTLARMLGYESATELMEREVQPGYVEPAQRAQFRKLMDKQGEVHGFESVWKRRDGSEVFVREGARAIRDEAGVVKYYEGTVEDITERKRSELELQRLNKELIEASRQAGMAEVATGVLHNVGNVLNSVNVSSNLVREKLRHSELASLNKLAALFQSRMADIDAFLTADPKGKLVPKFIVQLAAALQEEHALLEREHESLAQNLEHIKEIVAMQQNYARLSGVLEKVSLAGLVEDALRLHTAGLARHGVQIVRQFAEAPPVLTDKHKVLQIIVNLVHNAKYALDASGRADRQLTVGVRVNGDNRVKVIVADNGIGILPENLTRIFSHGFTTRKDGHGFGLHSGANAAKEMGGSLTAHSDGPGRGATFTLELPLTCERPQV